MRFTLDVAAVAWRLLFGVIVGLLLAFVLFGPVRIVVSVEPADRLEEAPPPAPRGPRERTA